MLEPIRLSKAVAAQLQCSRREAELLIESGCVSVAGQLVEAPEHRVSPDPLLARIDIASSAKPLVLAPATVLYFKPGGQSCWDEQLAQTSWLHSDSRAATDRSGVRLLRKHLKGLTCVAPLEEAASGLVVFTQDFRFHRKLVAERTQLENEVMVEVQGVLTGAQIEAIGQGDLSTPSGNSAMRHPGAPFKVSMAFQNDHTTGLRFALKGNQPGRLATICQAHRLPIMTMKRQRVGRLGLTGLSTGQWRFLMPYERF